MCVIGPSRTCPQASSYPICPVFSIWLQGSQQPLTALSKIPQTTSRLWWFAKTFNNTVYASVYFSCHCCNCDLYLERLCPLSKYRLCCAITSELFCSLCTLMNNTNFTQRHSQQDQNLWGRGKTQPCLLLKLFLLSGEGNHQFVCGGMLPLHTSERSWLL